MAEVVGKDASGIGVIAKRCLSGGLAAFVAVQLSLTAVDRNYWPLSSHNFFAFIPSDPFLRIGFVVGDDKGRWTPPALIGHAMPLEFFRANQLAYRWGIEGTPAQREALCQLMLRFVKEGRGAAFDETLAPIDLRDMPSADRLAVQVLRKSYDSRRPDKRGEVLAVANRFDCKLPAGAAAMQAM